MGMYTELVLKCDVLPDVPENVGQVLNFLFCGGDEPTDLPDHSFFRCERWQAVGRCNSYYHHPKTINSYTENYLFSRSDLKNYDGEIEKFVDWVKPYLNMSAGDCIGWSWYEEAPSPTLIFM